MDAVIGKHRRHVTYRESEAVAPLLRRAGTAVVIWLALFALFSLAMGWTGAALAALAMGALGVLVLAISHAVATATPASGSALPARSPGVNLRRNGYG